MTVTVHKDGDAHKFYVSKMGNHWPVLLFKRFVVQQNKDFASKLTTSKFKDSGGQKGLSKCLGIALSGS